MMKDGIRNFVARDEEFDLGKTGFLAFRSDHIVGWKKVHERIMNHHAIPDLEMAITSNERAECSQKMKPAQLCRGRRLGEEVQDAASLRP